MKERGRGERRNFGVVNNPMFHNLNTICENMVYYRQEEEIC